MKTENHSECLDEMKKRTKWGKFTFLLWNYETEIVLVGSILNGGMIFTTMYILYPVAKTIISI